MHIYTKILIFIVLGSIAAGCELIDISKHSVRTHIDLTQDTPEGVVCLFLAELDSNNYKGASVLLLPENGSVPTATQRVANYPEMQRLGRLLRKSPVTMVSLDTIAENKLRVWVEIDSYKNYSFTTERVNKLWFITHYDYTGK